MKESKQTRKKVNKCQLQTITTFMETYPQLQKGTITNDFTATVRHKKWQELCELLNSEGGAVKSVEKWQKCWSDYKAELKKKILTIKKQGNDSNEGFSRVKQFSLLDIRIAKILGLDIKEVEDMNVKACRTRVPEPACLVLKEEIIIDESTSCDTHNSESQTKDMTPKIGRVFHLDKASEPPGSTYAQDSSTVTLLKSNVPALKRIPETSTDVRHTNTPVPHQIQETDVTQSNSLASQQIQIPPIQTSVQQASEVTQEAINNPHPQIQITLYTLPPQQVQMPNGQAPQQMQVSYTHATPQMQVSNTSTPQQIQVSNTQAPQQIQVSNTQAPQQLQVSNTQVPQQIQISNAQTPQQMQVSYTHTASQMQVSGSYAPQQNQKSHTDVPQQVQEISNAPAPRQMHEISTIPLQQVQEASHTHSPIQIDEKLKTPVPRQIQEALNNQSHTQTLQSIQELSNLQAPQHIQGTSYTCTQETQTLRSRPFKKQRVRCRVIPAKNSQDLVHTHQAIVGSLDKIAEEMKVRNEVAKMKLELEKEKIEIERRKTDVFEKLVQHFITK